MDVLVLTSDRNLWALGPFSHLFNKYWSPEQPVAVVGYSVPESLPENFRFVSLGRQEEFPAARWSDALLLALDQLGGFPIILLEDYWLTREVDLEAVSMLHTYMLEHSEVLRMDLTTDRLYANNIRDVGPLGRLDLIQGTPDSEYEISMQAGIWNADLLRQVVQPGWTPWELETVGSEAIKDKPYKILGTRQAPVRYLIAIKRGEFSLDGSWQYPPKHLEAEDIEELNRLGLLEPTA